ncbi:neutral zinc metallopeptidase [Kribbella sp. HUAS MG21]|jgi:hypothetical protein|uniref:Neutral zinc metallopeptidase n=1 Tax=Kribbella sp. HUAS MG21 TaxID=3160966 RepID=A0AAU7TGT7_9ACTN
MRAAAIAGAAGLVLAVTGACAPPGETSSGPGTPTAVTSTSAPTSTTATSSSAPTPTYRSPEDIYLLHNALYSAGQVRPVACKLPDIALRTRKAVQQYSAALVDCLQRAWKPLVDRTDSLLTPPGLHTVDQGARTGCGVVDDEDEAFYCGDNTGIYLDWDAYLEEDPGDRVEVSIYLQFVVAHEFGHHLQHLVGISTQFDLRLEDSAGAAQLEQTRRHELQASCFAAAFLGAHQRTLDLTGDELELYEWVAHTGDDDDPPAPTPDHGTRKSNTAWTDAGFKAKSPAACNTWVVPASRVT